MSPPDRHMPRTGRGAASNPASRFETTASVAIDDGWGSLDEPLPALETIVQAEAARTIIARNSSPDIPFTQSINPYRGCEHACAYCLKGDTPILYADGSHRSIRDAKVGDLIIGTVRDGGFRRYVETRITNHWSTIKPAYRISLADGTTLVASGDHRFLTERGWKYVKGTGSGKGQRPHLTLRNRLMGTGAFASQPQECDEYHSDAWRKGFLAGIFDAEGHHNPSGPIRIPNTDLAKIEEIARALDRFGFAFTLETVEPEGRKPVTVVRIKGGLTEKLRLFHLTNPAIPRKRTIAGIRLKSTADLRVVSLEPLGYADLMYDITTGSGDFIANGVVSHNCYARPTHGYAGLSPGLDFETRLFYKEGAAELLKKTLAKKSYIPSPIALGSNTDPYQPIERRYRVTREILEVLSDCNHPATIVTKGAALIGRDIDLLADMARRRLVSVSISITTLDPKLKRTLEPRAASPAARLRAVERLNAAGVPVGVMVAPVIPFLTDHEAEAILEAARTAGAACAGYIMLRLPYEVAPLFREWLETHVPLKAAHVMSRVQALRSGRDNDPRFGTRQRGEGVFADIFRKRFDLARRRLQLDGDDERFHLNTTLFHPPRPNSLQGQLF